MCRLESGTATRFTCPYHGWTFSNTGALTGVPGGAGYRTLAGAMNRAELGLGRIRVETHRDFVFGTLDADAPPLVEHLGHAARVLDDWIDRSPDGEVRVQHGAHRMEFLGNWKLAYDNSADGYHPGFSHRSLLTMRQEQYGAGVDMQYVLADVDAGAQTVTDLGRGNTFLDQRGEIPRFWPQAAPSPGREAYEAVLLSGLGDAAAEEALEPAVGSGMNLNLFPNLLLIGNQLQVIEPLAVNRTRLPAVLGARGRGHSRHRGPYRGAAPARGLVRLGAAGDTRRPPRPPQDHLFGRRRPGRPQPHVLPLDPHFPLDPRCPVEPRGP